MEPPKPSSPQLSISPLKRSPMSLNHLDKKGAGPSSLHVQVGHRTKRALRTSKTTNTPIMPKARFIQGAPNLHAFKKAQANLGSPKSLRAPKTPSALKDPHSQVNRSSPERGIALRTTDFRATSKTQANQKLQTSQWAQVTKPARVIRRAKSSSSSSSLSQESPYHTVLASHFDNKENADADLPVINAGPAPQPLRFHGFTGQQAPQNRNTPLGTTRLQNTKIGVHLYS